MSDFDAFVAGLGDLGLRFTERELGLMWMAYRRALPLIVDLVDCSDVEMFLGDLCDMLESAALYRTKEEQTESAPDSVCGEED